MWLEFASQKNVQDGFDGFDVPGRAFKERIKRMLLTHSVVGSFKTEQNEEDSSGEKHVGHRCMHSLGPDARQA